MNGKRFAKLAWPLLVAALPIVPQLSPAPCRADDCPTPADQIATDRPSVTNSSSVVPLGSLQAENGIDWTGEQRSDVLSGTTTRLRLGVAHCTEVLADLPTYFYSLNGDAASGFSDLILSVKRELPVPLGFQASATGDVSFPTGAEGVSTHGYDPYIQFPWSRQITDSWSLAGMFGVTWFTSEHINNPTFEPTLSLDHSFSAARDAFVEYAGQYPDHARPAQTLDGGGSWRVTDHQQIDLHVGFGLNRSAPNHFLGFGYSFRFDGLF